MLPDLVFTQNTPSALTDANTTEDEDEAAEALLQLSKSDTIPEDDTELPLGILSVDAAPVPITLGNEDVLNVIENFKNNETETRTMTTKDKKASLDDSKSEQDSSKDTSGEKENKDNTEATKQQSQPTPESPLTSPTKGNLVIVKHGIKRKRGSGHSYKYTQCNKRKSSTQELNKHYRLKHKPLMCGMCNKLFNLTGTLKKHIYGHLDKPNKCDKCSESFYFESELTNHKVVH